MVVAASLECLRGRFDRTRFAALELFLAYLDRFYSDPGLLAFPTRTGGNGHHSRRPVRWYLRPDHISLALERTPLSRIRHSPRRFWSSRDGLELVRVAILQVAGACQGGSKEA